ncbi:MAG TPA: HD domain-containing phosphohydrolase [Ktedonobacteraceae bacterium]|nr:HD domain-containing phosphohydrolase [Ktedonobacteraceae bacterium]
MSREWRFGKVAIPYSILAKGDHRSKSEWETYYLHPYYTQRILERVSPLQELATAAAAHHEWINGQGYHRQLSGEQIPLHGRILAVANTYTRYIQPENGVDSSEALDRMRSLVDLQFDRSCYEALVTSLTNGHSSKSTVSKSQQLGNLTEREAEVLRLLAQGKSDPQIARTLNISRKTVEHHLTHIYNKIGVSCRTAAVVYAVQQGLV